MSGRFLHLPIGIKHEDFLARDVETNNGTRGSFCVELPIANVHAGMARLAMIAAKLHAITGLRPIFYFRAGISHPLWLVPAEELT